MKQKTDIKNSGTVRCTQSEKFFFSYTAEKTSTSCLRICVFKTCWDDFLYENIEFFFQIANFGENCEVSSFCWNTIIMFFIVNPKNIVLEFEQNNKMEKLAKTEYRKKTQTFCRKVISKNFKHTHF
jgi:hypothetical protein